MVRLHGEMTRVKCRPYREEIHVMLYDVLNDQQRKKFEEHMESTSPWS